MNVLWPNLKLIILKLQGPWKCTSRCSGCSEWISDTTSGFGFEGIKKTISHSLKYLVPADTDFFLYGKNIFQHEIYLDLLNYIKGNKHIWFDLHITTDMSYRDIDTILTLRDIPNVKFTFCQSYSTIDFDKLNKIIEIFSDMLQHSSKIIIVAEKDFEFIESYLEQHRHKQHLELVMSRYPIISGNTVTNTWIDSCLVLWNFDVVRNMYANIWKTMLIEILPNGDLRLHNYLCNLASINITNIYRTQQQILTDIKRFSYFYYKFHSKGDIYKNCFICIKKINYDYKMFDKAC